MASDNVGTPLERALLPMEKRQHAMWKYVLADGCAMQEVHMPPGAEIKHIAVQDGKVCLWALVNATVDATFPCKILQLATGERFDRFEAFGEFGGWTYLGTVMKEDGGVWHYFHD